MRLTQQLLVIAGSATVLIGAMLLLSLRISGGVRANCQNDPPFYLAGTQADCAMVAHAPEAPSR